MDDDTKITPLQMSLAVHGAVIALIKASVKHGLPLGSLLDEIHYAANVLAMDQAVPAAEVLRNLAAALESEQDAAASNE